jgi:hypothetical protein
LWWQILRCHHKLLFAGLRRRLLRGRLLLFLPMWSAFDVRGT